MTIPFHTVFVSQGSVVGGFLAQPANKYSPFRVHFFCIFPYLLPCLVSVALSVTALIVTSIFITETRPRKSKKQQRRRASRPTNRESGAVPLEGARLLDMEDFDSGTEMDTETLSTLSSSAGIQETSFTDDENCEVHISHSNSRTSLSTSSISESSSLAENDRVESESPSFRLRNERGDQLQESSEARDESDVLLKEDSSNEDSELEVQPVRCARKIKQKLYQNLRTVASKPRVRTVDGL